MSIVNRVMAMKAKPNKQEVKPETQSSHDKTIKVKQEKQKQLTPAQLAAIAAVSGKDQADRLKALLGSGVKPEAVKHLSDVNAPALAELTSQLPAEYALVAQFINSDEKPKRKELEASIAQWALANPKVMK